ncbi:phytoene desaturase family protein [Staphylococcus haemolyticus]|uniref:phytoene desaturase family protein n=1 Tax=Staphylococcus haemolyticus TaxID=1283 RepID=UPI0029009645|nr:NAD(P)/FAD-dependent oxidoreductase [Staphylococcus haemolyticus]MDU0486075.1 NAD(P)/FAD-dependent oxidoreductase [Staphylococcus haemolyticus]
MSQKKIIIIGGGLGGISAAIRLAQSGFDVSLYDKNNHIGGKVNRLETEEFGFDLGPSILTMPYIFENLFNYSDKQMKDYVTIERLPLQWRSFFTNGEVIDLYEDLSQMLNANTYLTNDDIQQLHQFLNYAEKIHRFTEKGYFALGLDKVSEIIKYQGPLRSLKGVDYFSTMQQAINRYIEKQELRDMLGYFIKYVGSSSYDAPAVLTLLIHMQYEQGLWYVKGGIHKLAQALEQLAIEEGVAIHTGMDVCSIDTYFNHVTGVRLDDGSHVSADYIVSNREVIPTYRDLLHFSNKKIAQLEKVYEPAASGYVMHLGVDKEYAQLAHHNFLFSNDSKRNYREVFHDKVLPQDPTIYLVNSNKSDPTQAPEGHENLKVLPHIPYIQNQPFTEEQYSDFRERVLDKLEKMGLTDLRQHIIYEDIWTPHDIERTYGSNKGAIYGVVADKKKNKGFKFPKQSEYFDNLFFVGGSVNPGGGMPMVTLSGQQVADKINALECKVTTDSRE